MCYSEKSSAIAFVVSLAVIIGVCIRRYTYDLFLGLFALTVALMQLAEFFMWRGRRIKRGGSHMVKRATQAAWVILLLQPASLVWLALAFSTTRVPRDVMVALSAVYGLFVAAGVAKMARHKDWQTEPVPPLSGHLEWRVPAMGWVMKIMYMAPLVLLALLKNTAYGAVILATVVLLRVFSQIKVRSGWRSLWCFLVNALPWVILVAGFLMDEPCNTQSRPVS